MIDHEQQNEHWMQALSTNQRREYGVMYEERRRRDYDQPAKEDNLRTVKRFIVSKQPMSYKVARMELGRQERNKIRPYDRLHVVNIHTFNAKQAYNHLTNTVDSTPTDHSMVVSKARKPRGHRYVNLNPHQNPTATELDFS